MSSVVGMAGAGVIAVGASALEGSDAVWGPGAGRFSDSGRTEGLVLFCRGDLVVRGVVFFFTGLFKDGFSETTGMLCFTSLS